jgi:hypothetical protein
VRLPTKKQAEGSAGKDTSLSSALFMREFL